MKVELSPIKKFMIMSQDLPDVISLGQGVPSFHTPKKIKNAAKRAIDGKSVDWYGDTRGLQELRWEISKLLYEEDTIYYNPETEILITPGASAGLSVTIFSLFNKDAELILLTPTYYPFLNIPKIIGVKVIPVNYTYSRNEWAFSRGNFLKAITVNTKGVIICIPNNPTGNVLSYEDLLFIKSVIRERNLILITDEVYKYFLYSGVSQKLLKNREDVKRTCLTLNVFEDIKQNWVRLMSFSKAWSMSGWRVGYIAAPALLTEEILPVCDISFTASSSLVSQYAALEALRNNKLVPFRFLDKLKERKQIMQHYLSKTSLRFSYVSPQGGYYFFLKLKNEQDDYDFSINLLKEKSVVTIPGSAFGTHGKGFIRISFCQSKKVIIEGMEKIVNYCDSL
ncbi:pyridoxal phosphate-dependent aminotransferase [Patescibacteria group bacterium]